MDGPTHFWVPSIATSGLMVYDGDQFPEWRGDIFAGGLAGEVVARLVMDGDAVVIEEPVLHGMGRVRDVRQGLDGYIYVAIEDRDGAPTAVYRMVPATGE
jgi:glucose/arabinose dehydrogenase